MYARRYWLPYFGELKIDLLDQRVVQGYWSWRIDYWNRASEDEREKHGNHALNPAKKSLDMEQSALREIFRWGHAMKLVNYMPVIANPYNRQGIAAKRRASFEPKEWKSIKEYLDEWAQGRGKNDGRVNAAHIYRRKLCRLYIHWIVNTGMRTGEVNQLRHRDIIRTRTDEKGLMTLKVIASQQTKTGSRNLLTQPECAAVYHELRALSDHTESDDWVFCDRDGKRIKGFYKTFDKMLEDIGLLYDRDGDKRTMYSFRHFYAEDRLREIGINPKAFDLLSANMGTSRQMIERHYVRKGIMYDEDALVGPPPEVFDYNPIDISDKEKERARKREERRQQRLREWEEEQKSKAEKSPDAEK